MSISDISIINPGGTGLTGGQGVSVALTLTDTGNDPVNITQITIGGVTFTPNTTNHQYITIQPGQSLSLTGTISTTATNTKLSYGTANGNSLTTTSTVNTNTFNVGSTVVIQVTATDIVTNQQLATQATTVVQD
ncbi:hypothetical protein [Metallosphaera hakonensis]|uniref:hypothetical protein n=1 Tax=Metallosphaera hakonensis TaxID=79601 RepID=UPI00209340CA|nr:hypothetical protein [Metallosphaera hakonensis]